MDQCHVRSDGWINFQKWTSTSGPINAVCLLRTWSASQSDTYGYRILNFRNFWMRIGYAKIFSDMDQERKNQYPLSSGCQRVTKKQFFTAMDRKAISERLETFFNEKNHIEMQNTQKTRKQHHKHGPQNGKSTVFTRILHNFQHIHKNIFYITVFGISYRFHICQHFAQNFSESRDFVRNVKHVFHTQTASEADRFRLTTKHWSTIFAEAGAGPGVGFLNENWTRSWSRSENLSFYMSRIIYFIKFKFSLNG